MSHVSYEEKLCLTCERDESVSYVKESVSHVNEFHVSQMKLWCMSHVSYVKESCLTCEGVSCLTCEGVFNHMLNEACLISPVSHEKCTATHCNTLQHTATHCNTLQHTLTDQSYLPMWLCAFEKTFFFITKMHSVFNSWMKSSQVKWSLTLICHILPLLIGSIKLQVSFAKYFLFYKALLQKRPIIGVYL